MKTISTFVALDMHRFAVPVADDDYRRLISTWWRQSGMLCVGGAASVINVWDCPTERCTRVSLIISI
jgi:regulator-associated protein of mTOR